MDILFLIIFIIIIIVLSGLISGTEAAILSISYTKVRELLANTTDNKVKKEASELLEVKENLQKYITTIVVLNNIVNIVGSVYVGVISAQMFGEIYIGYVSALLTFLIIMFAEIIPKIYGEKYSEVISVKIAKFLIFFTKILKPLIIILNFLSGLFVKGKNKSFVSEGEIKEMAALGQKEGSINSYESKIIKNVFEMNDIEAYEIMIPKNKTTSIEKDSSLEEIIKVAQTTGYTRFPIVLEGEVIGIINVKDIFKYHDNKEKFAISKILRPVIYAPEAMKISTLEKKLKGNRTHLAIIVNEHGDFTGIVTLEDIIEEVLGDIEDEFDREKQEKIKKTGQRKYQIRASCEINEINQKFKLDLPEDMDFNTLNGFLVSKLDKIPRVNDKVKIQDKGVLRVVNATKKKALIIELKLNNE